MQNDSKTAVKFSFEDFNQAVRKVRERMAPKVTTPTSDMDYLVSLMDTGLSLETPEAKDVIIALLAIEAAKAAHTIADMTLYFSVIRDEVGSRSVYDQDYQSMLSFLEMIAGRAALSRESKGSALRRLVEVTLKKHFKEEGSGAVEPDHGPPSDE
jgi:hypothetical protein